MPETTKLFKLVEFRGMILPMTKQEYQEFLENRKEWDN